MKYRRFCHIVLLLSAVLMLLTAEGCGFRPETPAAPTVTPAAEATPVTEYTVSFLLNGTLLAERRLAEGEFVSAPDIPDDGALLIGWTDENGDFTDIAAAPVTADRRYTAVLRPRLSTDAPYLFPDEHGLLLPAAALTNAQTRAMAEALLNGAEWELPALSGEEAEAVTVPEFSRILEGLFDPREAAEATAALDPDASYLSRAEAAQCVETLLGKESAGGEKYYPDVSPAREFASALLSAAPEGTLEKDALLAAAEDGFLWFDGYLYRLDENGYFLTDTTKDCLSYDGNGRYTCGNRELDDYVAATVAEYLDEEKTREENLHALYYHIKNDFMYLTRNYYDSGAVGWDIDEALTLFSTGKGNCYCYAGAFCALARGMGYSAVTYSGTMGNQNQKHAWTEITLEDTVYICDPEIEMNYWMLQMYTDNFMMPRKAAGGWNYQAVGRS